MSKLREALEARSAAAAALAEADNVFLEQVTEACAAVLAAGSWRLCNAAAAEICWPLLPADAETREALQRIGAAVAPWTGEILLAVPAFGDYTIEVSVAESRRVRVAVYIGDTKSAFAIALPPNVDGRTLLAAAAARQIASAEEEIAKLTGRVAALQQFRNAL